MTGASWARAGGTQARCSPQRTGLAAPRGVVGYLPAHHQDRRPPTHRFPRPPALGGHLDARRRRGHTHDQGNPAAHLDPVDVRHLHEPAARAGRLAAESAVRLVPRAGRAAAVLGTSGLASGAPGVMEEDPFPLPEPTPGGLRVNRHMPGRGPSRACGTRTHGRPTMSHPDIPPKDDA